MFNPIRLRPRRVTTFLGLGQLGRRWLWRRAFARLEVTYLELPVDDARRLPVQLRVKLQFYIGTINIQLEKEEK